MFKSQKIKWKYQKIISFTLCLSIVIGSWLSIQLSKSIIHNIKMVISYEQKLHRRADTIQIKTITNAWQLLQGNLPRFIHIHVNKLPTTKQNYVLVRDIIAKQNFQKEVSLKKILDINPDTLFIAPNYKLYSKIVPIKLAHKISFLNSSYGISKPIIIYPNKTRIYGPKKLLQNIQYIKTETLKLQLNTSWIGICQLAPPFKDMSKNSLIKVHIPVSEFTEKEFICPIHVINNRSNESIQLIPENVKIKIAVGIHEFNQINISDITATVDISLLKRERSSKLPIAIKIPPYSRLISVVPCLANVFVRK